MKIADQLLDRISGTTFRYHDILEQRPDMSYQELYAVLDCLEKEGKIRPIKNSGRTSFRPSVYQKYRKIPKKDDFSRWIPEIQRLNTKLNVEGYLKHPKSYAANREAIHQLSEFLWQEEAVCRLEMSVKEKSFAIWGDEKFLESSSGRQILRFNEITKSDLGFYETPEPFFSREFQKDGAVLVLENKDPWYSICRIFLKDKKYSLLGERIGLLIYGEGKKVQRLNALTDYLEEIEWDHAKILYVGDIDREGFAIFDGMRKGNPRCEIRLFAGIYEKMVQEAESLTKLPDAPSRREILWDQKILDAFSKETKEKIQEILEQKKMIPQEILNYQDYKEMCRGGECWNIYRDLKKGWDL